MQRAQKRNAAHEQSFYFRQSIFPPGQELSHADFASRPVSPKLHASHNGHANGTGATDSTATSRCPSPTEEAADSPGAEQSCQELSLNEIINGTVRVFRRSLQQVPD